MIDKEHANGTISGVSMNRGGPAFTNVMFVDDIMLFSKALSRDVAALNKCLETYCNWSGQLVNRDKSGIIFSKLVPLNQKRRLKGELQMKKVSEHAKYLGAPLFSSGSRVKDFRYLQEKLEARLKEWRSKSLSWAGRSTLIKSVAHAIPTYSFSTFDVPTAICDKLDAITRRFWWNPKKDQGRFLAWKSWDHLCNSKRDGGLGFRKAKMFNAALIAKLTWMVVSKRLSPCIVALRNKYKVTADWLREEPLKYASKTWKAIERMKILINNGACFLVGDGESIDVWKEPWVPWLHNFTPKPKYPSMILSPLKVADLIDNNSRSWNLRRIQELFDAESAEAISKIKIPATPIDDKLIWILDPKGKFSVKSMIKSAQGQVSAHDGVNWNGLWKLRIHERYKVLIWRIATGILPTKVNLALKLGSGDTLCPLCSEYDESIEHIFFHCAISRAIWFGNSWAVYSNHLTFSSCKDIINIICDPSLPSGMSMDGKMLKEQTAIQFAITLDVIWNLRNQVIHNDHKINLMATIKLLESRIMEHVLSLKEPGSLEVRGCVVWEAPPIGVIKINVDAAICLDKSFMAAVARDYKGELIKAWAKTTVYKDPTIAEADAICWALELAKTEKFEKISIESDAKVCVDALLSPTDDCPWKIRTFTSLALELAVYFSVCSFYWVKRDANHMADAMAKVAHSLCLPFCCSQETLPPSVKEA